MNPHKFRLHRSGSGLTVFDDNSKPPQLWASFKDESDARKELVALLLAMDPETKADIGMTNLTLKAIGFYLMNHAEGENDTLNRLLNEAMNAIYLAECEICREIVDGERKAE